MINLAKSQEEIPFCDPSKMPDEIKEHNNFVLCLLCPKKDDPHGKPDKVPFNPRNERLASATKPDTWASFADASKKYDKCKGETWVFNTQNGQRKGKVIGLGYVLNGALGIVGIDLDHCINSDGSLEPWAQDFVEKLNTYTERSPSKKGLRLFVYGNLPQDGIRKGQIELYQNKRYLTVTGNIFGDKKPIAQNKQAEIDELIERYIPQKINHTKPKQAAVILSDDEILRRLELARSAKNGEKFKSLFDDGDTGDYPSPSEAVQALCNLLVFWLGHNENMVDSVFRQSALFDEYAKWDEIHGQLSCGERAIKKAIESVENVYTPPDTRESPSPYMQAAERFLEKYPDTIFHAERFFTWNGKYWAFTDKAQVQREILLIEAPKNKRASKHFVKGVCDLLELLTASENSTTKHPFLVNFQNVEVSIDIKQGKVDFIPHTKEHLITKINPHEVLTSATYEDAPLFMKTCKTWFADDADCTDKITCLFELLGYCFLSDCRLEKFVFLLGQGSNGKSLFLNLVSKILGQENVANVPLHMLGNRFYCAELYGKDANLIYELDTFEIAPDGRQKSLASGDILTADFKYGKPFSFKNTSTMIIGCNHLPSVSDYSQAYFRRAIVISFNKVFKEHEQDKGLIHKLEKEIPAIIFLSLEAIAKAYARGSFTIPTSSIEQVHKWQLEADQVKGFVSEKCILGPMVKAQVTTLYQNYLYWADDAGLRKTVTRPSFTKRLASLGVTSDKSTNGNYYYFGIMFNDFGDL